MVGDLSICRDGQTLEMLCTGILAVIKSKERKLRALKNIASELSDVLISVL